MPELTDENFRRIEDTLEALSKRNNVSQRRQCWRTAAEMIDLVRDEDPSWTISALDASLCTRFLANEDCRIRPAYYPHEDTCQRLWGHVENVDAGPGRDALRAKLAMNPRPLEPVHLDDDAPTIFLSHALVDHHFAARVRLNLACCGVRSWLAEGDLHEGCNLFEAIEAALQRCEAVLVLVSSLSISSAWLHTEVKTALKAGKQVVVLADVSDAPVLALLGGWIEYREQDGCGDWLGTDRGMTDAAGVLERYMQVASPSRVLKFRISLSDTLDSFAVAECMVALYPDLPEKGPASWIGFAAMLDRPGLSQCGVTAAHGRVARREKVWLISYGNGRGE